MMDVTNRFATTNSTTNKAAVAVANASPTSSTTTTFHSTTNAAKSAHPNCTLAVMRALTKPFLVPPAATDLGPALLAPWNVRIPVDPTDFTTRYHWKDQKRTALFHAMLDWPDDDDDADNDDDNINKDAASAATPQQLKSTASLDPYFSFGSPTSPFLFEPWQDVGNCLRHFMDHQMASQQTLNHHLTLTSHDTDLFIATASHFDDSDIFKLNISKHYYLLRCHYNKAHKQLLFGYHSYHQGSSVQEFHPLHILSLLDDDDWRLKTACIVKNIARILLCLKDYAIPLTCRPEKLTLTVIGDDNHKNRRCVIKKVYDTEDICPIFHTATVTNMMTIYRAIEAAHVPHTDRLVAVLHDNHAVEPGQPPRRICQFAPIGRSYLPQDINELLDALVCVAETLVALGALGIMHRDIRWANVFHALTTTPNHDSNSLQQGRDPVFTREWVLFDFEFAAYAPQPAFASHTLTPGNHAPEMVHLDTFPSIICENNNGSNQNNNNNNKDDYTEQPHGTAVDVWGLGYLIQHAEVDIPVSHATDLQQLQNECLSTNPESRPTAKECLEQLQSLQARPRSTEKDIVEICQEIII